MEPNAFPSFSVNPGQAESGTVYEAYTVDENLEKIGNFYLRNHFENTVTFVSDKYNMKTYSFMNAYNDICKRFAVPNLKMKEVRPNIYAGIVKSSGHRILIILYRNGAYRLFLDKKGQYEVESTVDDTTVKSYREMSPFTLE